MPTATSTTARRAHRRGGNRTSKDPYAPTRQRAEALAEKIRSFWSAQGRQIRAWAEPLNDQTKSEWVVRSDLTVTERRASELRDVMEVVMDARSLPSGVTAAVDRYIESRLPSPVISPAPALFCAGSGADTPHAHHPKRKNHDCNSA